MEPAAIEHGLSDGVCGCEVRCMVGLFSTTDEAREASVALNVRSRQSNSEHHLIPSSFSSHTAYPTVMRSLFYCIMWESRLVYLGGNGTAISADEFSIACGGGCSASTSTTEPEDSLTLGPTASPTPGPAVETSGPAGSPVDSPVDSTVPMPSEGQDLDNTLILAAGSAVACVVGVALVALLRVLLRQRQDARTIVHPRSHPPATDNVDDDLEQNREKSQSHFLPKSAVVTGWQAAPYEAQSTTRSGQSSSDSTAIAVNDGGSSHVGQGADGWSTEEKSPTIVEDSTSHLFNAESDEREQYYIQGLNLAGVDSDADSGPRQASSDRSRASSAADHPGDAGGVGLGDAVLMAAQELAHHCQFPGVSEAVTVVCVLANLVKDCRDNIGGSDARLRQCHSIIVILEQAADVAEKVKFDGAWAFNPRV